MAKPRQSVETLYEEIREELAAARTITYRAVNTAMVLLY